MTRPAKFLTASGNDIWRYVQSLGLETYALDAAHIRDEAVREVREELRDFLTQQPSGLRPEFADDLLNQHRTAVRAALVEEIVRRVEGLYKAETRFPIKMGIHKVLSALRTTGDTIRGVAAGEEG